MFAAESVRNPTADQRQLTGVSRALELFFSEPGSRAAGLR